MSVYIAHNHDMSTYCHVSCKSIVSPAEGRRMKIHCLSINFDAAAKCLNSIKNNQDMCARMIYKWCKYRTCSLMAAPILHAHLHTRTQTYGWSGVFVFLFLNIPVHTQTALAAGWFSFFGQIKFSICIIHRYERYPYRFRQSVYFIRLRWFGYQTCHSETMHVKYALYMRNERRGRIIYWLKFGIVDNKHAGITNAGKWWSSQTRIPTESIANIVRHSISSQFDSTKHPNTVFICTWICCSLYSVAYLLNGLIQSIETYARLFWHKPLSWPVFVWLSNRAQII